MIDNLRTKASALALLLPLAACKKEPPPPPAAAPIEEARPSICPAEVATLPAFGLTPSGEGALRVEVLEAPTRGRCVRETEIMGMQGAGPRRFARIDTSAGTRIVPHHPYAFDVLAPKGLVLIAAASGLWAHDSVSLARVARLVGRRVVDVTVSADGTRFAYVEQEPEPADAPRTLVIVRVDTLGVVRSFENVPEGRLHLSDDGRVAVLAAQDLGVRLYDENGTARSFVPNDTVRDAVVVPGTRARVAYGGHDNYVGFHDLATGQEIAPSRSGPFVTRRDIEAVRMHAPSNRTFAGGADNELHVYEALTESGAREIASVRLDGNVVDVACCSGSSVATITDTAHVVWLNEDYQILREVGPLLPSTASADARIALHDDRTFVNLFGRILQWTRDGLFVVPDAFVGEIVAYRLHGADTLVVLRSRGRLEFHRVSPDEGVELTSTLLDATDWAVIDSSFENSAGAYVYVGREHGRIVAALVPREGPLVHVRGPLIGPRVAPTLVAKGDDQRFAVWDLGQRVLELDALVPSFRVVGIVEGERPTRLDLRYDDEGTILATDEAGNARTLAEPPSEP